MVGGRRGLRASSRWCRQRDTKAPASMQLQISLALKKLTELMLSISERLRFSTLQSLTSSPCPYLPVARTA